MLPSNKVGKIDTFRRRLVSLAFGRHEIAVRNDLRVQLVVAEGVTIVAAAVAAAAAGVVAFDAILFDVVLVARFYKVFVVVSLLDDLRLIIAFLYVLLHNVLDESSGLADEHSWVQQVSRFHEVPSIRVDRSLFARPR